MKTSSKAIVTLLLFGFAICAFAPRAQAQDFVVTNDDNPSLNTSTVFHATLNPFHLTQVAGSPFSTGSHGLGIYYLGSVSNAASTSNCIFISDAMGVNNDGVSDIAAFTATGRVSLTLGLVGNFAAPNRDSGSYAGVGLATSGGFLYASYTASRTIAVWQILPGCALQYLTEIHSLGLNGGPTDGMAVTPDGKKLISSYADGSIGAFTVGGGRISPRNEILAAGYPDGGFPTGVFIDSASKWAIFADFNIAGGPTEIDVAPITANGLGTPIVYGGPGGSLGGTNIGSANLNLSPDNTVLYVNGFNSGTVQSLSFNEGSGVVQLLGNCINDGTVPMTGFGTLWGAPGVIATITASKNGFGIYVALAGQGLSGNSSYVDLLTTSRLGCLQEQPSAPPNPPIGQDPNSKSMFSMSGLPRKNPIPEK